MRKAVFPILAAVTAVAAICCPATTATAQQSYSYTVMRERTMLIDWRPERNEYQRYTVSVSPLRLISHGVKFDFEYELPRPGQWLGTSLQVYMAPARRPGYGGYFFDDDGNNRSSFNSSFDNYHRMWGVGTSAFYKNTFARRGWYFSAGVAFDFHRVGVMTGDFIPYTEDGLQFYDHGTALVTKSYFKPTLQVNIGKHMAISERCYFDLYAGVGYSHSFYKRDGQHLHVPYYNDEHHHHHYSRLFTTIGGFAYRGLHPTGGFRVGVLLWKAKAK